MVINKWIKSNIKQLGFQAIVFERGTILEPSNYKGINHLVEHCMCCQFPKIEYILQKHGIEYNAYTTNTQVVFYISGLANKVEKISNLFFNNILHCNITEDVFDREKNIVLQEYAQQFSKQESSHIFNILRKKYNYCSTIGYKQSLENITYNQFLEYKNDLFKQPTYRWYISHIKPKDIEFVDNNYEQDTIGSSIQFGDYSEFKPEENVLVKNNDHIVFHKLIDCSDLTQYCNLKFLMTILQNGLSSPLINELRLKKGLIYNISCGIQRLSNNQGILLIHTSTNHKNVNKVISIVNKILNNLSKFINQKKFNYNKQCVQMIIKQMNILNYNESCFFDPCNLNYYSYLNTIQYDHFIQDCMMYFSTNKLNIDIDGE